MRQAAQSGLTFAAGCLLTALTLSVCAEPLDLALAPINAALQAGQADKALALISALPQQGQYDAQALNLACRVQFTLGQWNAAVRNCEQAVHLDPNKATYHMWLGRALGEKANLANFYSAYSMGKRVVSEFQQATRLDPGDAEALTDLGFFYVEAPSVVGGGLEKAESVVAELDRVDPARADELRARIQTQRKDYAAAEADLKKSIAVSHHPAIQWSSLARFYQERKRWDDMESAIHNCIAAAAHDPHSGVALYDAAGVLLRAQRNPALAVKLLQDYLSGSSKTEEAPAFVAYSRLAYLERKMGDTAEAQKDQAAATQMAREFQPALDHY